MTDSDFIIELLCRVDDMMKGVPKNSQASMYPSELVTLGIVFALTGSSCHAYYRCISRSFRELFLKPLEWIHFFRALKIHRICLSYFCADTSMIGLIDNFSIELTHPCQIDVRAIQTNLDCGWIIMCAPPLHHLGLVVKWNCGTANVYDGTTFHS